MQRTAIAKILVMHEPRKSRARKNWPGESLHDPYTEHVIFAVISDDRNEQASRDFFSTLLRECNCHPSDHTFDFLMSDTALDDIHSIVRDWREFKYRLAWDLAKFWYVTDDEVLNIDRYKFFDMVRDRVQRYHSIQNKIKNITSTPLLTIRSSK